MNVEAGVFFDLLLLTIHRNDEKVKMIVVELFDLFEKNMQFISDADVKHITLYISSIKEIMTSRLVMDKNDSAIRSILTKHLNSKMFEKDRHLKDAVMKGIDEEMSAQRLTSISERLNNFILWNKSNAYVKSLYGNLRECSIAFDVSEQTKHLGKMQSLISDFQKTINDMNTSIGNGTSVEKIDMTNREDIARAFTTYKERKVTHILKTGWQGLNRMFGPREGIALGESVIFCALPHNYKSYMLMNCANWLVKYSNPPKSDGRKNMILFISLENEAFENMMILFERIYITITGIKPVGLTDEQIVDFIYDYYNKSGYILVIERYLPSMFGFEELMSLYERYENSGYRIVSVIIDYLSQMKKSAGTVSKAGNHLLIKDLFNNVCNYTKAKGSTLLSAHQLNRDASKLVGSGVANPVKRFGEEHLADSMDVMREPDMVIFQHIERNENGEPFLTLSWKKHRYVSDTKEVDKYCAYPFSELGIFDDVEGEPGFTRNIHARKNNIGDISSSDIESLFG